MASPMARPFKHPRTGVYWFRQRVPEDVRALVGRKEVTRTLGTKDLADAKAKHATVSEEYALQWANLRLGQQSPTHRTLQALAGEFYREIVEAQDEDPESPDVLARELALDEGAIRAVLRRRPATLLARFGSKANEFLARRGLVFSIADNSRFVAAVARAKTQAVSHTLAKANGDYRPDPDAVRFPALAPTPASQRARNPDMAFEVLWLRYVDERKLAQKTVRKFHAALKHMVGYIGRDDVSTISEADLLLWREHLEKRPNLSPISIRDGYLASAKAFFGWAHLKLYIATNPTLRVKVSVSDKQAKRRGFTDSEANKILSAALAPCSSLISPEHAAARRWVPWICAYTGARVNEITQLRQEDLLTVAGHWAIRITPEAGTVKNNEARLVPLHPHLIDQGFAEYVKKRKSGVTAQVPVASGLGRGRFQGV